MAPVQQGPGRAADLQIAARHREADARALYLKSAWWSLVRIRSIGGQERINTRAMLNADLYEEEYGLPWPPPL
jgi:hypothetical protein